MEWTKVTVQTTVYGAEVITGLLLARGIVGAEIINPRERVRHLRESAASWDYAEEKLFEVGDEKIFLIFYVTADETGETLLNSVREDISRVLVDTRVNDTCVNDTSVNEKNPLAPPEITVENFGDEAWLHEWKKFFKPLRIGKIVVVPEWEECGNSAAGDIVFRIDPGSAFGTGQHETTRLCVLALQEFLRGGDALLDIGCGSGILSVIGLLLGAGEVFACDIDPAGAIAATKKNARLNPVDTSRLQIRAGDVLSDGDLRAEISRRKYQVIIANIVADVIIELAPFVRGVLADGGVFIASGIISERTDEVRAAFGENNFQIIREWREESWVCFAAIEIRGFALGKAKNLF